MNQDRPRRADAERNRRAIICAAASVFTEQGTDVTLEHIADVAGVGVGDDLPQVLIGAGTRRRRTRREDAALCGPHRRGRGAGVDAAVEGFRDYVLFMLEQHANGGLRGTHRDAPMEWKRLGE
ncbi:hypothetical protein [Rhodococcus coprophilus]|nr:hypothetical protein [Rhodococcus coprophilus]